MLFKTGHLSLPQYSLVGQNISRNEKLFVLQIMNIPGEIPIGSRIKREFYLTNTITSEDQNPNQTIEFSWSPTSTCSVEPSFGQVEPGQSLPLQLWCSEKKTDNFVTLFYQSKPPNGSMGRHGHVRK